LPLFLAYSYYGASVATIVSMLISFGLHVFYLNRSDYRPTMGRALVGPVVAMAAGWGPFLVSTMVMTALYLAALFGLRVLKTDDLNLLKQFYRTVE